MKVSSVFLCLFSSSVGMYRKNYGTTVGVGLDKMLKFTLNFLCDGQGAVR